MYNTLHLLLFPQLGNIIRHIPQPRGTLVDLGCGTGIYALLLASVFPEKIIIGLEAQRQRVEQAKKVASDLALKNVLFKVQSVLSEETLPQANEYLVSDLLIYFSLKEQRKLLTKIGKVLEKDGLLLLKGHQSDPAWKACLLMKEEGVGKSLRSLLGTERKPNYYPHELWIPSVDVQRRELHRAGFELEETIQYRGSVLPHILYKAKVFTE